MKFRWFAAILLTLGGLFAPLMTVSADAVLPPVYIRELKITGDEFVVLEATQTVNLADYWLGYSSNDTATTIMPTQQLPTQTLQAGDALLLTSDGAVTCDAVLITKLSFSLSDTKGALALRQLQNSGSTSTFSTIDSVTWSKPSATATTTNTIDLRKETTAMTYPVWYHSIATLGWFVGNFAGCTLTFGTATPAGVSSVNWPQNDAEPPAIIESLSDDGGSGTVATGAFLPAADIGLLPPQITELLPNPSGTGTDGTDEFIELYNPNGAVFDLSGFKLRTGLTTKHAYTFPAGTTLPPKSFVAFMSADTGLTLSNTGSQADLQDPFGVVISQSDAYESAKDGNTWAMANGAWYWTLKPTPSAANVINQSPAKTSGTKSTAKVSSAKAAGTVKSAATKSTNPLAPNTTTAAAETPVTAPIHPYVLAGVIALAVGYGVYEHRNDIRNRFYQLRTNRAARRNNRE